MLFTKYLGPKYVGQNKNVALPSAPGIPQGSPISPLLLVITCESLRKTCNHLLLVITCESLKKLVILKRKHLIGIQGGSAQPLPLEKCVSLSVALSVALSDKF